MRTRLEELATTVEDLRRCHTSTTTRHQRDGDVSGSPSGNTSTSKERRANDTWNDKHAHGWTQPGRHGRDPGAMRRVAAAAQAADDTSMLTITTDGTCGDDVDGAAPRQSQKKNHVVKPAQLRATQAAAAAANTRPTQTATVAAASSESTRGPQARSGRESQCVCGDRHAPPPRDTKCYSCEGNGHRARCCPRWKACARCNVRHAPLYRGQTCDNCGDPGHRASCCTGAPSCPCGILHRRAPADLRCNSCDKPGHRATCCPARSAKSTARAHPSREAKEEKATTGQAREHKEKQQAEEKKREGKKDQRRSRASEPGASDASDADGGSGGGDASDHLVTETPPAKRGGARRARRRRGNGPAAASAARN